MLFREEGDALRAIVYYPKSENAQKELSKRVSEVHVEFVLNYLKQLQLSKEQTEKIITKIHENTKKNSPMA